MLKKILGAMCILVLTFGFVVADEFKGKVTKVDGAKITVKNKADEKTFDTTGAKIQQKKGKEVEAAAAGALKEGAIVSVNYEGTKVSDVTILAKKKKQN